jgi:hypothetical protein
VNINEWRDDVYAAPQGKSVRVADIDGKVIKREAVRVRHGSLWFVDEELSSYDYWRPTHWSPLLNCEGL